MQPAAAQRIVVVLGPGRSGTSLVMQALHALGMELSPRLLPGSAGNPKGFMEDEEIVNLHKGVIRDLGLRPGLPYPANWYHSGQAHRVLPTLRRLVDERLSRTRAIWGFKDPRTASLLPLWHRALTRPGVVPVYILAVRDPLSVVASLRAETSRSDVANELLWLQRTVDALYYTAADCFIVHYEDWFSRPDSLAQGLLSYTGLDQYFSGAAGSAVRPVIDRSLNRSVHRKAASIENLCVRQLDEELQRCRDADFDRESLMAVVRDVRQTMAAFSDWHGEVAAPSASIQGREARCNKQYVDDRGEAMSTAMETVDESLSIAEHEQDAAEESSELRQRLESLEETLGSMRQDLEALTRENSNYLAELKTNHDRIEELRAEKVSLDQEKDRLTKLVNQLRKQAKEQNANSRPNIKGGGSASSDTQSLVREVEDLRNSYSYRIGQAFVLALTSPGRNTLKLPFRFVRLLFEAMRRDSRQLSKP